MACALHSLGFLEPIMVALPRPTLSEAQICFQRVRKSVFQFKKTKITARDQNK